VVAGVLFAIYCLVFGDSGIITRARLAGRKAALQDRIARQEGEGARLQELLAKYRRGESLRDEAYRAGFIEPGSAVLFFGGALDREAPERMAEDAGRKEAPVDITHLRVLWAVISAVVIMLIVVKQKNESRTE